jgi:glycogen synthase kinase 3 beta
VFEYVPDSLENYIQETKQKQEHIPLVTIKSITKQILQGLNFAHNKNICHRDLKPDNILLDEDHNAKLCDFGSSKKMDSKDKRNIPHIVSRYYRAPELMLCHTDYSTPIDIWAVGCIFVEMFTLEPLFQGKTEGLQLFEIMAVLGTPKGNDKEYLYEALSESVRESLEKVKDLPSIDLKVVFPTKHYSNSEILKAADLARQMLEWNPSKRITAKKALEHPFFKFF